LCFGLNADLALAAKLPYLHILIFNRSLDLLAFNF
jgi:hypothetical protein